MNKIKHIISYVRRVQALDKIAAYVIQACYENPNINHTIVFDLERTYNQIPSCESIFSILSSSTNKAIIIGISEIHNEVERIFKKSGVKILYHKKIIDNNEYIANIDFKNANLLIQRNGIDTPIAKLLYNETLKNNGRILRFFKSLHDKNSGLTAYKYYNLKQKINRNISKIKKYFHKSKIEDYLLTHGKKFEKSIENANVFYYKKKAIAYPLTFPSWKKKVLEYYYKELNNKYKNKYVVTIFARGEIEKRPASEQILSNNDLIKSIDEIINSFKTFNKTITFLIKPHPNQNVNVLNNILNNYKNIEISFDPPSLLAAYSNITIGLSTSALLDGLFFNKPAINYYQSTEGIKLIHPKGSLMEIMNIPSANNKEDLIKLIKIIFDGKYKFPNLIPYVGKKTNMSEVLI